MTSSYLQSHGRQPEQHHPEQGLELNLEPQPNQQPGLTALPSDAAINIAKATQTLRERRRTSVPASVKTTDLPPTKRYANYIRSQPTSPQVISSLIDQLSAISIPAHNHFENLLRGYDALPSPTTPTFRNPPGGNPTAGQDGASIQQYQSSLREQNELYADDACEPPVIRTSKPPSGLSPLTAPKKRDKPQSLSGYPGRSGGSSCSLQSTHSNHSANSFGNISIEAAAPKDIGAGGSNRSSAESKRSFKAHRSLMYMSSRERLRQKETEKRRVTVHNLEDPKFGGSPKKPAPQLFPYEDTIKEEPVTTKEDSAPSAPDSSIHIPRFSSGNNSPRRLRINLVDQPDGATPSEKGLIPERGSSLKHTGSPPGKNKKRMNKENSSQKSPETIMASDKEQSVEVDEETEMKDKIWKELEQDDYEVIQRIRELKEQKKRRELMAGKLPSDVVEARLVVPPPPHVLSVPSPIPSPASTVSAMSERRQDPTKAHKILGIQVQNQSPTERLVAQASTPNDFNQAESNPLPRLRELRPSRPRSLTWNDGEDHGPLPINYALALRRLDEPRSPLSPLFEPPRPKSPPHSVSNASIVTNTSAKSASTLPARSRSVAVGGRSAIVRRTATDSVIMTVSSHKHKHSSSMTDSSSLSKVSATLRPSSEDMMPRHKSMIVSPETAAHSLNLQRKKTQSKKRWSHPDLPAKAEKEHNAKMDRAEARSRSRAMGVQTPPIAIIEERPTSLDSVDVDVQSYLNSSRLSQKIRHPQTGRVICFSEVGDPQGYAVFVCVGMGLTRYVMAFYDQLALTLKLRLITPERPGVGGSQADPNGTPLNWPDDVLVICQSLKISKFSLLAHSAGAVYALATSLRMPQHIRGRVHLLAPWIPPSQMAPIGLSQDSPPTQQLPRSQRFLRALPPSLLKVANSTFLSATSASLQRTGPKTSPKTKRKVVAPQAVQGQPSRPSLRDDQRQSIMLMDQVLPNASSLTLANQADSNHDDAERMQEAISMAERERQRAFDERLTFAIWDRATANANPATDLIVCLETKQTIGFRYEDINRPVVIHHGSKDSRVPVDNVRWLGKLMRKCEVRILEGEQHGLMASAQVMGNVLTEIASDWEDWTNITQSKDSERRAISRKRTTERLRNQISFSSNT